MSFPTMFQASVSKAERKERIAAAKAAKDHYLAIYREARERAKTDPMRRMLGGLAPWVVRTMVAKADYHRALNQLKAAQALRATA